MWKIIHWLRKWHPIIGQHTDDVKQRVAEVAFSGSVFSVDDELGDQAVVHTFCIEFVIACLCEIDGDGVFEILVTRDSEFF